MTYIFPLIAGFTTIIAIVQNGRLSKSIGLKNTTLLNFITGLTGTLLIFLISKESFSIYANYKEVPLLGYLGGMLGVSVVMLGTFVIRKISVIASTMLTYAGQLIMGLFIDIMRHTDISVGKIIGCILIIIGVYVNGFIDSKIKKSQ